MMPQQKSPIKLQVARCNLWHGLSIQVQVGYGGHLQLPCRRPPRHGGHLQNGKSGEWCVFFPKQVFP